MRISQAQSPEENIGGMRPEDSYVLVGGPRSEWEKRRLCGAGSKIVASPSGDTDALSSQSLH